jgi:hypothetical protein
MQAVKGLLAMEKWLCLGSLGVAGFVLLLFVLDIALGIPFGGRGVSGMMIVDIVAILASAIIAYLAYDAYRDVR